MTPTKKRTIQILHEEHYKLLEIADHLGTSKGVILQNLQKLEENPDPYAYAPQTSCPPLLSNHDKL